MFDLFGRYRTLGPRTPAQAVRPLINIGELRRHARRPNEALIRALCQNAYLGDQTSLCRVLGKFKMLVDTGDVGLSSHLLLDGYWEMWLTEAIVEVTRPGMLAIDIGSNLGYFSLLMAERVGAQGRVHAFEVNPHLADRAHKSADLNGFLDRLTVHSQALGDVDGAPYLLIVPEGEPKNGHIVPAPAEAEEARDPRLVRTRRLDSYPELLDADVIKIDADTAEEAIWHGMAGILARDRSMTIFLEFAPVRYRDPRAFLNAIVAAGFRLDYLHLSRGILPTTIDEVASGAPAEDRMLVLRR